MSLIRTLVSENTKKVEKIILKGWEIKFTREYNEGSLPKRIEVSGIKLGDNTKYLSGSHATTDNSFSITYGGTAPDQEITNAVFDVLQEIILEHQPGEAD